ncbi:MAG: hypothetical protein ACM4AI_16125 [Acidobacteriota bacterium]
MTRAHLDATIRGTVEAVRDVLNELDDRVKRLEGAPSALAFLGAWDPAVTYHPNQVVQHAGTAWCSTMTSTGVPPSTSDFASNCWKVSYQSRS